MVEGKTLFSKEKEREKKKKKREEEERKKKRERFVVRFFCFFDSLLYLFSNEERERERERWTCCLDPTSPSHRKR